MGKFSKSFIKEFLMVAVIASIVGNTFGTFNSAVASNKDNLSSYNVSSDQLNDLLNQRLSNPERYNGQDPILLNIKKDSLSKGIQNSLQNKASLLVTTATSLSSQEYGTIKDPNTGATIVLKKSSPEELVEMSPQRFSHFMAMKDATRQAFGPYGKHFGVEALTFYAGVGANHVFNLLTSYEKNPMALEMFIEELQDPIAQLGFFAFMVGNRYAQAIFQDMMTRSSNVALKRLMTPVLGFLAMGVGSVFSNITHDLITLTKPCATALTSMTDEKYDTSEERIAKCQEGWNAVMTSDNLARYVTSVMTVIGAAFLSAAIQQGYKFAARKILPLDTVTVVFKKVFPARKPVQGIVNAASVAGAPSRFAIRGLGIKIVDLVIFLQADELLHPYVHYLVESVGNSSPKLASTKQNVNLLINKLNQNNWKDVVSNSCKQAAVNASFNHKDHIPAWVQNEMKVCTDGFDSLLRLHEKEKKWRDTLSYDFMSSYLNWMRFISEFVVMHDVSREYFAQLIAYSANRESDIKNGSYSYNPLAFDSPFYGINLSRNMPVADMADFRAVNKSRALRIVESLSAVNTAIEVARHVNSKTNNKNDEYLKILIQIKKLIEVYKKDPTTKNYKYLLSAVKKINTLNAKAKKLTAVMRQSRDRFTTAREHQHRYNTQKKLSKVTAIRNYLGDPNPLEKGSEAFFQQFNDFVKKEKSEYVELFDEKGTPAETLTWYAVCGNKLNGKNVRVDKRRTGVATVIDSGINLLFSGVNKVTNWLADKANVENDLRLRTDVSPALNAFESIKFGTGVDFYVPRIVKHDMGKYCAADAKGSLYSILPQKNKSLSVIAPDGKKYDSLFSYLVNNIKPEVLNIIKADDGTPLGPYFAGWWDKVITPKVELAHKGFVEDYNKLLSSTYRDAIDGGYGRDNVYIEGLSKVISAPRVKPWMSASSIIQSYAIELGYYLRILEQIYSTSNETNGYLKKSEDLKLFKRKILTIRGLIYSLLNDFRNFNTEGLILPKVVDGPNAVPKIVDSSALDTFTLQQKYALLLLEIRGLYLALGFDKEIINAAATNSPYFEKKNGTETIPPITRLTLRIQNDPAISKSFNIFAENYASRIEEPYSLTYGLTENNFRVHKDGFRINPEVVDIELVNFYNNDKLTMAFLASNQLYALAEDLYTNISILDAAKADTTFKAMELPKNAPKGQGSRSF